MLTSGRSELFSVVGTPDELKIGAVNTQLRNHHPRRAPKVG